jgi:prepilin-type N-terminal cleavage/methylation domain-containing protein
MNKESGIKKNNKREFQDSCFMLHDSGMSLLEVLVVVAIFAILGILVTRAVILTLQGSQKSDSLVKVRENLDYSLSIIERQIRSANSITPCPNPDSTIINYLDQSGNASSFSCVTNGTDSYIASGSARLTSNNVGITSCSIACTVSGGINPPLVTIDLTLKDAFASGVQNTTVSSSTQIYLRSY